eukprot:26278-Karenia_brevis.AAC.1
MASRAAVASGWARPKHEKTKGVYLIPLRRKLSLCSAYVPSFLWYIASQQSSPAPAASGDAIPKSKAA